MGGDLTLRASDRGATFRATFPAAERAPHPESTI
jgi:hypothetical protein